MNKSILSFCLVFVMANMVFAQQGSMPKILSDSRTMKKHFLPDFSYAGYQFGEKKFPTKFSHTLKVTDYGAKPNDGKDDSDAFIAALNKANELKGYVLIRVPSGSFNINKIIYINRSKTVLRGVGAGEQGTVLFFQRPLRFVPDPPEHEELLVYLTRFNKRQRDKNTGLDAQYSQYSWSGGFLWVAKKGKNYKSYNVPEYNQPITSYAKALSGKRGGFKVKVNDTSKLEVGSTYKLTWFNKDGENGSLLKHLYDNQKVVIGEHHWNNPDNPLLNQMVLITKIDKNTVTIKAPLLYDIKPEWFSTFAEWEHIEEVGIENMAFEFPMSPDYPHHLEDGNNPLYLTSLMNGWVSNVRIKNADSGILTDDISNVTIEDVFTHGDKKAHYSVAMGEVHNVLVNRLRVQNDVHHTLSFNTRSTRSVYTNCVLETNPILDQHSGANGQNLFDKIKLYVDAPVHRKMRYRLFVTGGSKRWFPGHAAFSTLYNINLHFANVPESSKPVVLHGTQNGVSARLIGVRANHPVKIDYNPNPYIELTNKTLAVESLYQYQLRKRLKK